MKVKYSRLFFNVLVASMNQRRRYARLSTDDQHQGLQRVELQQAGCSVIYEEAASGKNAVQPELEQCGKAMRAGDSLVVWRLDRLIRSLPDLAQIVNDLEERGVGFESLTEKIGTGSATDKLIFREFAALVASRCARSRRCYVTRKSMLPMWPDTMAFHVPRFSCTSASLLRDTHD